jgi:hypothetical protein
MGEDFLATFAVNLCALCVKFILDLRFNPLNFELATLDLKLIINRNADDAENTDLRGLSLIISDLSFGI